MTTVRLILLALGVAFIGYLIAQVGPATLVASFQTLSWRVLVVLIFPFGLVTMLDTLGWRFAFQRDQASFLTLYSVRLAGEAFNITTPTASLGGEPVKAYLLRPRVPLEEGLASVIVAKTTITLAQGCFLVVGLALAWFLFPLPSAFLHGLAGLLLMEALALGGFVLVQFRGLFGSGLKLLRGMGIGWGQHRAEKFRQLDRALATFYREHGRRLAFSILFHFLGWVVGSLEVYLILYFLGIPVSLATALVIDAFASAIKFAAFLIPGGLGALEGGNIAVFAAFGLSVGLGLSFTLIRRLRELTWVTAGLVLLALLRTSVTPDVSA
ncbi:MAG: flippase-like domain-containing protein [Candidatus Rokubacteria bacterium]|nr:flippase-like domain-containing protein [Candidatus Rokubacteria bacterium]